VLVVAGFVRTDAVVFFALADDDVGLSGVDEALLKLEVVVFATLIPHWRNDGEQYPD
jgi:hypothetical protein